MKQNRWYFVFYTIIFCFWWSVKVDLCSEKSIALVCIKKNQKRCTAIKFVLDRRSEIG